MNSLSNLIERLMEDQRVRIGGVIVGVAVIVACLGIGNWAANAPMPRSKAVSVLPERALDVPMMRGSAPVTGVDAILAWQQPTPKAAKPGAVTASKAGKQVKAPKGTLTARR